MDLTKEAIKFMTEMETKPHERIIEMDDDRLFSVNAAGNVEEIYPKTFLAVEQININTLSGIVNYIKANIERIESNLILHIKDEKNVSLMGTLEVDGDREMLATARAIVPRFDYGHFHDMEEFNIALQSKFVSTEDREILLQVIGNVSESNVKNTGDDGVSQAITVNQSMVTQVDMKVPNPVVLAPFRTFVEVDQPESQFIFRMKDGPRGAIFEADGGAWRNEAIVNVREYFEKNLNEEIETKRITILA